MMNRIASLSLRAALVLGFAATLTACGHGRHHHDHHDGKDCCAEGASMECCKQEGQHECCAHGAPEAASQPAAEGEQAN